MDVEGSEAEKEPVVLKNKPSDPLAEEFQEPEIRWFCFIHTLR